MTLSVPEPQFQGHSTPCPEKKEPIVFDAYLHQILTDFRNFFHFYNLLEICNKAFAKYPIAPKMCHYITL